MKKSYILFGILFITAGLLFSSCKKDDDELPPVDDEDGEISMPADYEFESRFNSGVSSVGYGGQVVRNMLIQDIKKLISDAAAAGTPPANLKTQLLALYEYNDNGSSTLITTGGFSLKESVYENISTGKNLSGKMATINASDTVIGAAAMGYGPTTTADDLVRAWIDSIDYNINTLGKTGNAIYYTSDSLDLVQMIEKVTRSVLAYGLGTRDYLDGLDSDDNATSGGNPYTEMEHHWDEAFGYFGAARNYLDYTDAELASGPVYQDANSDGDIDLASEYNFGFSTNAGKRDAGAVTATDFTKTLFEAFVAGRTAITNQRSFAEIEPYARFAAETWEKVIAATVIHYINDTKADLDALAAGSGYSASDHYKHWSEMKGFLIGLQFGSNKYQLISTQDLVTLHNLVGAQPEVNPGNVTAYKAQLDQAAELLRTIYNFDQQNVNNWKVSSLF